MGRTSLPPGFRFHPTDVELILYYLKRKVMRKKLHIDAIAEVELYKYAPWDLPDKSCLHSKDLEWYFFCPCDRKYPKGSRSNRATETGYWKTSGKDRIICHDSRTVGSKKTLIFHEGKAPGGERTDWVMYEFRLKDDDVVAAGFSQDAYVLCKIFKKSGLGPRIGEQYGAPFNENEWDDVKETEMAVALPFVSGSSTELAPSTIVEPLGQQSVVSGGVEVVVPPATNNMTDADDVLDPLEIDGISLDQLAEYLNDSPLPLSNADVEFPDLSPLAEARAQALQINTDEMYYELEELMAEPGGTPIANSMYPSFMNNEDAFNPVMAELGNDSYVELNDLFSLGAAIPSEPPVPNDLTAQYPLEHCSFSQIDKASSAANETPSTSFMANESHATILCPSHDDPAMFQQVQGFDKSLPPFTSIPSWGDDGYYWQLLAECAFDSSGL